MMQAVQRAAQAACPGWSLVPRAAGCGQLVAEGRIVMPPSLISSRIPRGVSRVAHLADGNSAASGMLLAGPRPVPLEARVTTLICQLSQHRM